jgi:hypothetical protein
VTSTTLERARVRPLALARTVPVWAWLAGLVVLSTVVRYGLGRRTVAPWIFVDELIYSELAKSFAERGELLVRDTQEGSGFGVVYPVLISPAYLLFDSLPAAYAAAKAINALLMSLAAVPAYLLARRVLAAPGALAAAMLAVALPSLFYASTLMTENAFYPLFLTAALALVLVLERPTPLRTAGFLGLAALCYLTRAQAALLLPVLATAPLVLVALRREPRRLVDYRWVYALPAAALVALLALQAARGRSPLALLGAYRAAGEVSYDWSEAARWLLWHAAELDLSVGVVPVAALLLLLAVPGRLRDADLPFLAAAATLTVWMVVMVAVFASRHSLRVEERNMFYVAPLLAIVLLLWVERGAPRPLLAALPATAAAVLLAALVPFERLIGVQAVSDTFGLLAWWEVNGWGLALDRLWIAALGGAVAAALLFLLVTPRAAPLLPALLLVFFLVTSKPVETRIRAASIGELFQGITRPERDWVDRAVGRDGDVAALWSGRSDHRTIFENEFFSRSIRTVYTLAGELPGSLVETPLVPDEETGRLLDSEGRPVPVRDVLVDETVPLHGSVVSRDARKGMRVLHVEGALRLVHRVDGAYDDGWSGRELTYTRYDCAGGTLLARMESDPKLFAVSQTATAFVRGREVARARIPRDGTATIRVPLRGEGRNCVVRFEIAPIAVPGREDRRQLGTHFRTFEYRPR